MTTPHVLALDLSLASTGCAWLYLTQPVVGTIKPKTAGVERLADLRRDLDRLVESVAPDLVALEGYAYGRANQAHQVGEWGGVARLHLADGGIPFVVLPPSTVKKYATGKGNASKPLVLTEAVRRLDYQGSSTDEADSLWILAATLDHYGAPIVDMPKANRAALAEITSWPVLS